MNSKKLMLCLGFALAVLVGYVSVVNAAARPVRIAIVAATGSGSEQQVVDALSSQLQDNQYIVLSTVNPDWYVSCRIDDHTDVVALTVRVNGTVTIKTVRDGDVLNTISAQANKQDYNTGGPTPLNKTLVTSAMREVVQDLTQRSVQPIEQAVVTEIDTREKIETAKSLAQEGKYDQALEIVKSITRDSPHFWPAHTLADQIQMKKNATLAKTKSRPALGSNARLKALEAEKRALDARRKAIEAQEAAIRSNR